jgi:hypothetical protein
MNRRPVSSANILSVGWQESEEGSSGGTLEVAFRSGHIYRYTDVPESTYQSLLGASSVGKTFRAIIMDRYDQTRVA